VSEFRITDSKGFQMKFPNGWTVSVQWGPANYCDNYHEWIGGEPTRGGWRSTNAEVWAWDDKGDAYNGEDVRPRLSADEVLAYMNEVAARPARQTAVGEATNG
jgi:hypothetical protein